LECSHTSVPIGMLCHLPNQLIFARGTLQIANVTEIIMMMTSIVIHDRSKE
jgi:hypothetical protein